MNRNNAAGWRIVLAALVLSLVFLPLISSLPQGVSVTSNETYNFTVASPASIVTAGGSFAVLTLNVTTQNMRWKAYVGNVTGVMTLADSSGSSVYDWTPNAIQGEVYAVRTDSPTWTNIGCAPEALLLNEGIALRVNNTGIDSINSTFNTTVHKGFYVGATHVPASQCRAISTFVDNQRQAVSEASLFQQILLSDGSHIVYTTLLEDRKVGYNNELYDFQLILPNDMYGANQTRYWFYAELT